MRTLLKRKAIEGGRPLAAVIIFSCVVWWLPANANIAPETNGTFAPTVEVLELPHGSLSITEDIVYRVRITWAGTEETIRIHPPKLRLKNLEFVNVSKERSVDAAAPYVRETAEQIMTFRFRSRSPGEARILDFELPWSERIPTGHAGTLRLPTFSVVVKKPINAIVYLIPLSGAAVFFAAFAIRKRLRKRVSTPEAPQAADLETRVLSELDQLQPSVSVENEYLDDLSHLFGRYCWEKFNLPRSEQNRAYILDSAKTLWSQRVAGELNALLTEAERLRYGGETFTHHDLASLHNRVRKFIKNRRII